jgi:hypothetical protein
LTCRQKLADLAQPFKERLRCVFNDYETKQIDPLRLIGTQGLKELPNRRRFLHNRLDPQAGFFLNCWQN